MFRSNNDFLYSIGGAVPQVDTGRPALPSLGARAKRATHIVGVRSLISSGHYSKSRQRMESHV